MKKVAYITSGKFRANDATQLSVFLCVDAHALQHAEIHGRWNNHFHLSRLHLILKDKVPWNYKYSVLLSEVLKSYKKANPIETIDRPERKKRGRITVIDVEGANSQEDYNEKVAKWADAVFESYHDGHAIAREVSILFTQKLSR